MVLEKQGRESPLSPDASRVKNRIFIIICLLCLLFSGCGIPDVPVADESTIDVPVADESTIDVPVADESTIDVPVASESDIIAASGSASDIQAAADAVYAAGGGTVYIPEGDFNLGGDLTIRDRVSLIGAGIGNTILHTQGTSMGIHAQGVNPRISGFSLIAEDYPGTTVQWSHNGIYIDDCVDFRVDHLYIEGYSASGVRVSGIDTRGVIDHCGIKMKTVTDGGYGVVVYRDGFWEEDMRLGTEQATFIEDCEFVNCRHAAAANSGAHYVFRHNLVRDGVVSHAVDAHGVQYGSAQGTRAIEVYDNVIEPGADSFRQMAMAFSGGGGVVFNNTISGYDYAVRLGIPNDLDLSSYPVYHQVHDLWIWNNSHDGLYDVYVVTWNMSREYIQEDRDFFQYSMPGYTPYTYPHPLVRSSSS